MRTTQLIRCKTKERKLFKWSFWRNLWSRLKHWPKSENVPCNWCDSFVLVGIQRSAQIKNYRSVDVLSGKSNYLNNRSDQRRRKKLKSKRMKLFYGRIRIGWYSRLSRCTKCNENLSQITTMNEHFFGFRVLKLRNAFATAQTEWNQEKQTQKKWNEKKTTVFLSHYVYVKPINVIINQTENGFEGSTEKRPTQENVRNKNKVETRRKRNDDNDNDGGNFFLLSPSECSFHFPRCNQRIFLCIRSRCNNNNNSMSFIRRLL